jgi:hypothetical protein
MELNLDRFSDDMVHVSQLLGQNTGGVWLYTMAQFFAVFSYGYDISLNGTAVQTEVNTMASGLSLLDKYRQQESQCCSR